MQNVELQVLTSMTTSSSLSQAVTVTVSPLPGLMIDRFLKISRGFAGSSSSRVITSGAEVESGTEEAG